MILTLQLIKDVSRVFQRLLKYFNGTAILKFFVQPSSGVFLVIFILDSYDSEVSFDSFGSSL